MKYLKKFDNHTQYETYTASAEFITPNVSLCEQENEVHYNPYVVETRLVCKYNVTSTSSPTALRSSFEQNIFKSMEIDDVMLNELVTEYTFATTGEHIVKYELYDETKLGNNAPVFYNRNLIECIIPNNVTTIGANAFNSCISLTSIDIPDGVTSIGNSAFGECTGLTSITIPDSVTSIDSAILSGTAALKVLNYNAKCDLSNNVRNNVSWLNLETVIIGDSTPSISNGAFANCSNLTNVIIGSSVTSIGYGVFINCSGLTSITSLSTTAPTITSTTFNGVKTDGILTVPNGSTGYEAWMSTDDYYLGKYNWTKVEQ